MQKRFQCPTPQGGGNTRKECLWGFQLGHGLWAARRRKDQFCPRTFAVRSRNAMKKGGKRLHGRRVCSAMQRLCRKTVQKKKQNRSGELNAFKKKGEPRITGSKKKKVWARGEGQGGGRPSGKVRPIGLRST